MGRSLREHRKDREVAIEMLAHEERNRFDCGPIITRHPGSRRDHLRELLRERLVAKDSKESGK